MKDSEIIISRNQQLTRDVILVNGFPGCGKTMLSAILAAFDQVEIMQYPFLIEQICELRELDSIDIDSAESMIRMNTDLLLYNVMMGRQVNCRPSDLSSIFKHQPIRHIRRMFSEGDEKLINIIEEKKPILHLITHMQLASSKLLFGALKENLSFIEVIRHPLYMLIQMEKNFKMYSGPRNQHITYKYKEKEYPYFVRGWEKKFDDANTFENAIYSLDNYYSNLFSGNYHDLVELVPFERFVKSPDLYISMLSSITHSPINKKVKKEMSKQKVPRTLLSDGPALEIYKRCGWQPPQSISEIDELNVRRELISQNVSTYALDCLDRISEQYTETYLNK